MKKVLILLSLLCLVACENESDRANREEWQRLKNQREKWAAEYFQRQQDSLEKAGWRPSHHEGGKPIMW